MARPNWEYIRVDVLLPEHPKIDLLSRSARWTLIEMWCYCARNRTDGMITGARWKTFGTPGDRRQIADAGFAEPNESGGWTMHDFTEHQRSRAEIEELSARRAEAGRRGGMARSKPQASASSKTASTCLAGATDTVEAEAEAEAEARKAPPPASRVPPRGAPRATRLPPDFAVTAPMAAWAAENVPKVDWSTETMRFRDYWDSAGGAKARKVDWAATWRNWMREADDRLARSNGTGRGLPPAARPSTTDQRVAAAQALKAELTEWNG